MPVPVHLAGGEHTLVEQPVVGWEAEVSNGIVTLIALIQPSADAPTFPALAATSVAFRMDFPVAMRLCAQLGELGHSMG